MKIRLKKMIRCFVDTYYQTALLYQLDNLQAPKKRSRMMLMCQNRTLTLCKVSVPGMLAPGLLPDKTALEAELP